MRHLNSLVHSLVWQRYDHPLGPTEQDMAHTAYPKSIKGGYRKQKKQKHKKTRTKVKSRPPEVMVNGFINLGNSCYMNSAVQCLLATKAFVDYLVYDLDENDFNHDNRDGSGGEVVKALRKIFQLSQESSQSPLSLCELKGVVSKHRGQFRGYYQEDAQEFLLLLLDIVHEDLNTPTAKEPYKEPDLDKDSLRRSSRERLAAEAWDHYYQRNCSIVVDLFQGQAESCVKCDQCRNFLLKYVPFMYLSLPVRLLHNSKSPSLYTLENLLKAYHSVEKLGEPCWYCPKCKTKVPVEKCMKLFKLPPILIILYEVHDSLTSRKLTVKVDAPMKNLDMSQFTFGPKTPDSVYDLYAVVDHMGSADLGHYTASCLYESQWMQFNDTEISHINESEVINRNNYILFYQQRSSLTPDCLRTEDSHHHQHRDYVCSQDLQELGIKVSEMRLR